MASHKRYQHLAILSEAEAAIGPGVNTPSVLEILQVLSSVSIPYTLTISVILYMLYLPAYQSLFDVSGREEAGSGRVWGAKNPSQYAHTRVYRYTHRHT